MRITIFSKNSLKVNTMNTPPTLRLNWGSLLAAALLACCTLPEITAWADAAACSPLPDTAQADATGACVPPFRGTGRAGGLDSLKQWKPRTVANRLSLRIGRIDPTKNWLRCGTDAVNASLREKLLRDKNGTGAVKSK